MDIIATCTLRNRVFLKTFDSFQKNLFRDFKPHRLVANIDPVGEDNNPYLLLSTISEFFGNNLKIKLAEKPNFMEAFLWAWSNGETDYLFQIEDDWVLLRPFDFSGMLKIMDDNPNLAYLRFSSWPTDTDWCKQWNKKYYWNGSFFECPIEIRGIAGFCGHPGILRKEFIHSLLPLLKPFGSPEKQINNRYDPRIKEILRKWTYGVFAEPNSAAGVKDIGRKWRASTGFHKNSLYRFTTWNQSKSS